MDTKIPRWLTVGCLAATGLVAAMFAPGASDPSKAVAPPARAADDFSPYVTKDGGISRPTNYRETFLHLGSWAVAKKPDQPVFEMHNVYSRPADIRAYRPPEPYKGKGIKYAIETVRRKEGKKK